MTSLLYEMYLFVGHGVDVCCDCRSDDDDDGNEYQCDGSRFVFSAFPFSVFLLKHLLCILFSFCSVEA